MYRVTSAGCPPKQKSWLRRWPRSPNHSALRENIHLCSVCCYKVAEPYIDEAPSSSNYPALCFPERNAT